MSILYEVKFFDDNTGSLAALARKVGTTQWRRVGVGSARLLVDLGLGFDVTEVVDFS